MHALRDDTRQGGDGSGAHALLTVSPLPAAGEACSGGSGLVPNFYRWRPGPWAPCRLALPVGSAGTAPPLRQDGAAVTGTPLEVERRLLDGFRASAAAALPREVRVLERRVIDARGCERPVTAVGLSESPPAPSQPHQAGPAGGLGHSAFLTGAAGWESAASWSHRPGPPCLHSAPLCNLGLEGPLTGRRGIYVHLRALGGRVL